jgi:hypothetical protein
MEKNINKIEAYVENMAMITMISKIIPMSKEGDLIFKIDNLKLTIYDGTREFYLIPDNTYLAHYIAQAAELKIIELLCDAVELAKKENAKLGEQAFDEAAKFLSEYKVKKEYLKSM